MTTTNTQTAATESEVISTATAHFDQAASREGLTVKHFEIGGRCVQMRYAGDGMTAWFSPAFEHLATDRTDVDLVVHLWESDQLPFAEVSDDWSPNGVKVVDQKRWPWVLYQRYTKFIQWLSDGVGFVCCRNLNEMPAVESAVPLRSLINAWFSDCGGVFHGAAVGDEDAAVFLAGVSGAGKSSTALSCLAEPDFFHLGDDLCLLTNEGTPMVSSIYNAGKLVPNNVGRFADFSLPFPAELPEHPTKKIFFLYPEFAHKLAKRRPLRAILLPTITNRPKTQLVPTTDGDAWRAIVPISLNMITKLHNSNMNAINEIIHQLPVYRLELGTDRTEIVGVIRRFLKEGALS